MTGRELLFVYGTLRPPLKESQRVLCFNYPKLQPYLHRSEPARLVGAELYDLGSFPAAIPGSGVLTGVLHEIDRAAFEMLDELEGHPDLYWRARVQVETEAGVTEAWVYWAPEDLARMGARVPHGDWLVR